MRLVDLSMPIWEGAGYGEVLAMPNTSVRFYEYMTYDWHGIRRTELKLDDESGSPMMTIWQRAPHTSGPIEEGGAFTWHIDEVPLDRLILRPTAVIDVPAGEQQVITADDIDAAVGRADYRDGDEVLVRTGWATVERAYELGDRYPLLGPSWSYEACVRMADIMVERRSSIVMTDTPLIMTPSFQGWAWSVGPERIKPRPKPWPSIEARERLLDLPPAAPNKTERPVMPEWVGPGGYRHWIKTTLAICKCLVNANQITTARVRMLIVPLRIKNGGASPTRFVAVEEEDF